MKLFLRGGYCRRCVLRPESGTVKLTVAASRRKKAIIAALLPGSFFGEGCLGGQSLRMYTARSIGQSNVTRLEKESTVRTLKRDAQFAALFNHICFPRHPGRRILGRPILQFQRKATGTSVVVWANNQGVKARTPLQGEPGDPRGDGWYHPRKGERIYEFVQEEGLRHLQRRLANKQRTYQRFFAKSAYVRY